jgi:type IV pilus assembly protein PilN
MYNVDINFLKNRPEYQNLSAPADRGSSNTTRTTNYSKAPIFAGLGVGVTALIATGAFFWFLDIQGQELQAKQIKLDKELGAAKEQETKLTTLQAKIAQTEQESQSLAGAFNLVRPWSAIMHEFRESTPQSVQISSIIQTPTVATAAPPPKTSGVPGAAATKLVSTPPTVDSSGVPSKGSPSPSASASPAASPSPAAATVAASPAPTTIDSPVVKIEVEGIAQSFNDVNSFILTLKQSPLFNPEETQLISSELVENKVSLATSTSDKNAGGTAANSTTEVITKSVKYKLQTALKQIPATELLQELERKGAIGIVTRLKTLQQQKVIKP